MVISKFLKKFYLLLAICFIPSLFLSSAPLGDANNDSQVNIVDALVIAQYTVGLNVSINLTNADVNCDKSVSIIDALLVAQYSVGSIAVFPCVTSTPTATTKPPTPTPTINGNCGTADVNDGPYFYMANPWGGGNYCIWYNNINSWGCRANESGSGIKGYPAIVRGCHWNTCSANSGLPKQINALGSLSTSWTQSSSGNAWDAAYDIWFDPSSNPGAKNSQYELMVWLNWVNTQPIAASYDGNGAVPYRKNVSLGGQTFNVYRGGDVFSFLLVNKSNSINFSLKPLIDYCVSQGWMSNSVYLISIQAGWEIIQGGTYSTSAFSISGL